LIAALKHPSDGSLPDLRIANIDSDLGTGDAYPDGSCGPKTLAGYPTDAPSPRRKVLAMFLGRNLEAPAPFGVGGSVTARAPTP
jgi:hypothetical protein